jgi:hypothetical protein
MILPRGDNLLSDKGTSLAIGSILTSTRAAGARPAVWVSTGVGSAAGPLTTVMAAGARHEPISREGSADARLRPEMATNHRELPFDRGNRAYDSKWLIFVNFVDQQGLEDS